MGPFRSARRRVILAGVTALALGAALLTAGCGTTGPVGPPITVATTLYPLAQVVAAVGGPDVRVVDLTMSGQDPRTLAATPARTADLRSAALDVEVGGGFQPALEQASPSAHVVTLAPRFGPGPDGAWLDPVAMEAFLPVLSAALTAADPRAHTQFANGRRDLYEQLASVSSEYQDALSACPRDQIAAPDSTLSALAGRYHLHLHQLGTADPAPAGAVAGGLDVVSTTGIDTVLTEPWVSDATATAVARGSGVNTRLFDTAEAPPAGGWPRGTTYIGLLDKGLSTIAGALSCPSTTDTQ